MRLTGFLLLVAGWVIVAAALLLLPSAVSRAAFVLAGIGVQLVGLFLAIRAHQVLDVERG
jgi:hypothetical protein